MVCYPQRVYKNEDIQICIPVDFETEPNEFQLIIFTDNNYSVDVPFSALTIEDGIATVSLEPYALELCEDGIIRYQLSYSEGDNDHTDNMNTNLILKTPNGYSGKTQDDIWNNGYNSGYTDGQGVEPDCSEAYESGITEGIRQQKAKLTNLTATTNMTYERTDGYKKVVVNVAQTGYTQQDLDNAYDNGYEAGLNDCSGSTDCSEAYQSGYTEGYDDGLAACSGDCEGIYESGYTAGQNDQYVIDHTIVLTNQSGITITSNGTYTNSLQGKTINEWHAWSSVTVNVPQTGYTQEDIDAAFNGGYNSGYTDGFESGYREGHGLDYKDQYLTFEILSGGSIWSFKDNLEFSVNGGAWTSFSNHSASLSPGDIIRFRGDNAVYGDNQTGSGSDAWQTSTGLTFNVYGNVMSIIDSVGFRTAVTLTEPYALASLFERLQVKSARNLVLPATTLSNNCYTAMFMSTPLEEGPKELPATNLAQSSYRKMFYGCYQLTSVCSVLPATTLAEACYLGMFENCYELRIAPELPATQLATDCYKEMFVSIMPNNLCYLKCLATDISASGCTSNWLSFNSNNGGVFIKAASMNDWTRDASGIPSNWTVVNAS